MCPIIADHLHPWPMLVELLVVEKPFYDSKRRRLMTEVHPERCNRNSQAQKADLSDSFLADYDFMAHSKCR